MTLLNGRHPGPIYRLIFATIGLTVFFLLLTFASEQESDDKDDVTNLENLEQLKRVFERDSGKVRLLTLLSPTCPKCLRGFSEVQKFLGEVSDDNLRVYIVWLPILKLDDRQWAVKGSSRFQDPRLRYYWDEDKMTGEAWQKLLGLESEAWDVFFLYSPRQSWDEEPPVPDFWMHQLSHIGPKAPRFNRQQLTEKVKEFLATAHN